MADKGIGKPISLMRYIIGRGFAILVYSGYFCILAAIALFDASYRKLLRFYIVYARDEMRSIARRKKITIKP